jgi:F-type H+-transporting ATPase subunit b
MNQLLIELPALVNPSEGLIFWMTLTFLTVLFLLKKFAWKPMLEFLQEREQNTLCKRLKMPEQK